MVLVLLSNGRKKVHQRGLQIGVEGAGVPARSVFHCEVTLSLSGLDFRSYFASTCLVLPQTARLTFPSHPGTQIWVSMRAVWSKLLLSMGRFLFPKLAMMEELNSSNARRRGTGDDEGSSSNASSFPLSALSPLFFLKLQFMLM